MSGEVVRQTEEYIRMNLARRTPEKAQMRGFFEKKSGKKLL
jgi:hypothetical protein